MTLVAWVKERNIFVVPMWTYCFATVLIFLLWRATRIIFFGRLRAIPGPFAAKYFSSYLSLADLRGERAQTLAKLHDKYGCVVRVGPNKVSVSDWKAYRDIYGSTKASSKDASFYSAATFLGPDNIFSMRNHTQHSARRKLVAAPYSLQAISTQEPVISAKAELLLQRMLADTEAYGTANTYELSSIFSFEVICSLAFSKEFAASARDVCLRLIKSMDGSAPLILIDSVMPFLAPMGLGIHIPGFVGDAYRAKAHWEQESRVMVEELINLEKGKSGYLLAPLLNGIDSFLGRSLTREEVVEEAMGIMFAGSGTTSTTLVYLLYALSRPGAQAVQERLREEVQGTPDELQALRSLPLLNAVIKETFRLYPTIISTLPRIVDTELTVGKFVIPTKTQIGMQNYVHHRDPTLFPSPAEFLPDRWMQSDKDMESALTPFSVGPYNCIGQNLAWAELYLSVSKIVRATKLRLADEMKEEDMEMEDRFNIAPKSRKLLLIVSKI